ARDRGREDACARTRLEECDGLGPPRPPLHAHTGQRRRQRLGRRDVHALRRRHAAVTERKGDTMAGIRPYHHVPDLVAARSLRGSGRLLFLVASAACSSGRRLCCWWPRAARSAPSPVSSSAPASRGDSAPVGPGARSSSTSPAAFSSPYSPPG